MSAGRLDVLAHELRSPVAALAAIAEAVAITRPRGEQACRLVELAIAAGRNIERLVSDGATESLRPEPVDLRALAADTVEAWSIAGHRVVLAERAAAGVASGDPQRLRQALDNLVANALGHSPAGEDVVVDIRILPTEVAVTVTDRGEGIATEDQDRVFEAGVRATGSRPGSGLGLAIVRAVAEAHGGRVELASRPGAGAVFRLVLPRAADPSG